MGAQTMYIHNTTTSLGWRIAITLERLDLISHYNFEAWSKFITFVGTIDNEREWKDAQ